MTKKEILTAAEENSMNYCIQRGMAKAAFIDGALWALGKSREALADAIETLNIESHEEV